MKWNTLLNEEHVPLCQYMSMFALKAVLLALFGKSMKDDKAVLDFHQKYDLVSITYVQLTLYSKAIFRS